MGYASRLGRARISARNPQAVGVCDKCGFVYNHNRLSWQYDWRGASLMNIRMLVCDSCLDRPQEQLRAIVVPADPVPVMNPRVQDYVGAETNYRTTSGQDTVDARTGIPVPGANIRVLSVLSSGGLFELQSELGVISLEGNVGGIMLEGGIVSSDGANRVTQQTGEAPGGLNILPGTLLTYINYGNPTLPYGMVSIPETGSLPGVYYVVWNNYLYSAQTWTNSVSQVVTWTSSVLP